MAHNETKQTAKQEIFNMAGSVLGLVAVAADLASGALAAGFRKVTGQEDKPESQKSPLFTVRLMGIDHE